MTKIPKLKCQKCGHEWIPRISDVRKCPNPECQSVRWDKKDKPKIKETYDGEDTNE